MFVCGIQFRPLHIIYVNEKKKYFVNIGPKKNTTTVVDTNATSKWYNSINQSIKLYYSHQKFKNINNYSFFYCKYRIHQE